MKKVYLHVLIPDALEYKPLELKLFSRAKRSIRRLVDWAMWIGFKRFQFRSYNYVERANTNRGDIAIKRAIEERLRQLIRNADIQQTVWGELNQGIVEKINSDGDLFVIAGGGYWVFDGQDQLSQTFRMDFPFLMKIKSPIVAYGVGMNHNLPQGQRFRLPNPDPESRKMLTGFRDRVALLSLRDDNSLAFWKSLGCTRGLQIPDPAVFLSSIPTTQILHRDKLAVGVNFAFHGKFMEPFLKKNFGIYVQCLKKIVHENNARLHYFVHSDEENLIVKLLRHSGLELEVVDLPAEQMLSVYAQLDIHICQMLHSNILAFNAGIPALNLAYDSKNMAFNRLIGMEDFCIDANELNEKELKSGIETLIDSRKILANKITLRKAELGSVQSAFLDQVLAIIQPKTHSAGAV